MKTGILTFEAWHGKQNIGSSRIRGHWLIKYWKEAELFQQGAKYDAVIFQKVYWLEYLKNFKGVKILDLCDPDWLDTVPIVEVIDECDAVTTSTRTLKEAVEQFTDKPVFFIPDRQDLKAHPYIKKEHKGKAEWAVWFGYSHNAKVLDRTIRTLRKNNLKLKVISNCRPPYSKADMNVRYDWEDPEFDFNKEVASCDFVLMPPDTRPRGKFKSKNKIFTAWALGVPVVSTKQELTEFLDPGKRQKEHELLEERRKVLDVRISVKEFKELIQKCSKTKKK